MKLLSKENEKNHNTVEEINYVDSEDWLWSFIQDFEEYKKDNQSKWMTSRELFKEFIYKKQGL